MVGASADVFIELGIVVIIAGIAALIFRYFKQPQILAYVLVGVLLKPILQLITLALDKISIFGCREQGK